MYNAFKKIAKRLIPKQLLDKNESYLRKLISLKYKGKNHQCNICDYKLSRFVNLNKNDLLCPHCGSLNRTRRLYKELISKQVLKGNVLHFSPPKILYQRFKSLSINYFSSDFENEFTADYCYDITAIPIEDNFFDVIVCYHVLEHIENDLKAMSELQRVLKPNGVCYIQTPYKEGDIYEDTSVTTPEMRKKLFGQKDHVRVYSIAGLEKRLVSTGLKTEVINFNRDHYFGFKNETIIIAHK